MKIYRNDPLVIEKHPFVKAGSNLLTISGKLGGGEILKYVCSI
jgi:hypothetical protein